LRVVVNTTPLVVTLGNRASPPAFRTRVELVEPAVCFGAQRELKSGDGAVAGTLDVEDRNGSNVELRR
jgi:hypothetical protein